MIARITHFHGEVWSDIAIRCTPLPEKSICRKVFHVLPLLVELPFAFTLSCVQTANKILSYVGRLRRLTDVQEGFSSVLSDSRQWTNLINIENQIILGKDNSNFLFGVATSTYQDSGSVHCPDSQWASWETKILPGYNQSGKSANLFTYYKTPQGREQITNALHQLGINSYRFSIDWSQIEPKESIWNESILEIYVHLCRHLRNEEIAPMITLHHFSEPLWFHEKGSFANEENIEAFLHFSEKIFLLFTKPYRGTPLVEYFCTINEPAIDAFSRFVRGSFSPGILLNFKKAAIFLKGALKAHILTYEKLKKQAPSSVKIGIVHQYLKFTPSNPLLFPITYYLTLLINDVALHFFRTGKFEFTMPFVNIRETMSKPKNDFCGLQYYVRPVIGIVGPTSDHSPMTQMPFHEDPEGIYEAIIETYKACQVPIIITENGISTHDEKQRARYLLRSLYATQKASETIGVENVLGFYLWSFSDNFEWDMGLRPQAFGAFDLKRELKVGVLPYTRITQIWRKSWQEDRK